MNHISDETICAISTAAGVGGIAVIRVSGSHAIAISDKIFKPLKSGKSIAEMDGNTIQFGRIVNNKNEIIDEVLISLFRNPHSFTGEDVVEIGCHGSLFIQQEILKLLNIPFKVMIPEFEENVPSDIPLEEVPEFFATKKDLFRSFFNITFMMPPWDFYRLCI